MAEKKTLLSKFTATKVFFLILFFESLFLLLSLLLEPSAPEGRFFLLYSAPRFVEILVALFVVAIAIWGINIQEKTKALFEGKNAIYSGLSLLIISRLALILLQIFAQKPGLGSTIGYVEHIHPLSFFFSLIGFEITLWALMLQKKNKYSIIAWGLLSVLTIFSTLFSSSFLTEWAFFGVWAFVTLIMLINLQESSSNLFTAILIALIAFLFQISLQAMLRPYATEEFYFQEWSSETMMQSVSLKDLQDTPFETLSNIHTKPPGFDAIRVSLLRIWPAQDMEISLLHVDFLLYQLWALLYSVLGTFSFLWLLKLTDRNFAIIASFALLLHPASIQYSTLLDSNFLTVFLVFIFYYFLWGIKNSHDISLRTLIIIALSLFFTRAIFQWPFIIVAGLSLFLLKVEKRKILFFVVITGAVALIFGLKQYYQFGTLSTSSFTGLNLNRSVGNPNYTDYWVLDIDYQEQKSSLPNVLTRRKKTDGSVNYNHIQYLEYNQELIENYKEYMLSTPITTIIKSYWENIQIYFRPSTEYHTKHTIVDRLPWKDLYDQLFSSPILPLLLFFSGVSWIAKVIKQKDYLENIGLVLPGLYIFLVTILFEKGENMRFKFFLEPLFFIFIISQIYNISKHTYTKIRSTKN
ncbi:MAG: hypothetical protein GY755_09975 [Chloroflexi bacterium]|nr:hypothetical protein [Chloroflexota bacterium]